VQFVSEISRLGLELGVSNRQLENLCFNPVNLTMTCTEGANAGQTILGICQLDGDTFRICVNLPGTTRLLDVNLLMALLWENHEQHTLV
jgi:hypothetical protein